MEVDLDKVEHYGERLVLAVEAIAGSLLNVEDTEVMSNEALDPGTAIALGLESGYLTGTKFGRNSEVDIVSTPEDVWEGGGLYTGQPSAGAPETVSVASSSADDDIAGTGARTLRIFGLKSSTSEEYEYEDITLAGTTEVVSNNTWWRINRAYVLTAGTGGTNAGAITLNHTTTTSNVFAVIQAGIAQTQVAAYTVPANRRLLIKRIRAAIARASGAAGSSNVTMRARAQGGVYRAIRSFELTNSQSADFTSFGGDTLEAGTDIKFTIESVSDNSTTVETAFEYILTS